MSRNTSKGSGPESSSPKTSHVPSKDGPEKTKPIDLGRESVAGEEDPGAALTMTPVGAAKNVPQPPKKQGKP